LRTFLRMRGRKVGRGQESRKWKMPKDKES
jgi:hypothetical protein